MKGIEKLRIDSSVVRRLSSIPLIVPVALMLFSLTACWHDKKEAGQQNEGSLSDPAGDAYGARTSSSPSLSEIDTTPLNHDEWLSIRSGVTPSLVEVTKYESQSGSRSAMSFAPADGGIPVLSVNVWPGEGSSGAPRLYYLVDLTSSWNSVLQVVRNSDPFALELPCQDCLFRDNSATTFQSDVCYVPRSGQVGKADVYRLRLEVKIDPTHVKQKTFCLRPTSPTTGDQQAFLALWNSLHEEASSWDSTYFWREIWDYGQGHLRHLHEDKRTNQCVVDEYVGSTDPNEKDIIETPCIPGQSFP